MRQKVFQFACIVLLLVVFGSHFSELFDQWDHTLQTGNDIESVLVVLALTAGAVLTLAGAVVFLFVSIHPLGAPLEQLRISAGSPPLVPSAHSPPPLTALRI